MKRIGMISVAAVLALMTLAFTACGKTEFGVTENTEKRMTITAEKAGKDIFFISGSLEAEDGDQIVVAADLTKGKVRVEILAAPEKSMEESPEIDGTPVITATVGSSDRQSGTVSAGRYLVKATCLERATGTVQIEVIG